MAEVKYSVSAKGTSATRAEVDAGNHTLVIDEPAKLGGGDEGPNPLEYLLSALAGCLNVTGWKVAKEMGISLNGLDFEVSGKLDPTKFMKGSGPNRAGFSEIAVAVRADTDASGEKLREWAEAIEARCPVSSNLHEPTNINISVQS